MIGRGGIADAESSGAAKSTDPPSRGGARAGSMSGAVEPGQLGTWLAMSAELGTWNLVIRLLCEWQMFYGCTNPTVAFGATM